MDVSVGGNEIWGVNRQFQIWKRTTSTNWVRIPGGLKQVAVSDKDHVWGVNNGDYIYRRTGNSWQQVSGRLKVVSVGQSGVWGVNSNDDIFYRTGTYGDPDTQGTGVGANLALSLHKMISNVICSRGKFKDLFLTS